MLAILVGALFSGQIVVQKWKAYAALPEKYEYKCVDGVEYFYSGHSFTPHYKTTSGELYGCTSAVAPTSSPYIEH